MKFVLINPTPKIRNKVWWYAEISTLNEYLIWITKYGGQQMREVLSLFTHDILKASFSDKYKDWVKLYMNAISQSVIDRLEQLVKNKKIIYLCGNGSGFIQDKRLKPIAVKNQDEYPIDEIKLSQWKNGIHWYAKVGNLDVVIDNEQKWDTKEKAKEKAYEFIKQL